MFSAEQASVLKQKPKNGIEGQTSEARNNKIIPAAQQCDAKESAAIKTAARARSLALARTREAVYPVSKCGERRVSEVINPEPSGSANGGGPRSRVADPAA